jgi:hypothetical protein
MEYSDIIEPKPRQIGLTQRADNRIGDLYNDNYNRYVAYDQNISPGVNYLFSDENLDMLSKTLYDLLKCLRKDGRPIVVTRPVIAKVLSQVQSVTVPPNIGDMYTMYTIPQDRIRDDITRYNEMTIELIYTQIKTEYEMVENNKKLTIWTTQLGDFNEHGLRQYYTIKLNNKPLNKLRFNMNY